MATTAKTGKPTVKSGGQRSNPDPYRIPVAVPVLSEQPEDHMMGAMGYILAVVLVALLLPLGAFLYLDILETKNETKRMLEKIEKIEQRLERKSRDKTPDTFDDNPIFDRLRRFVSISMPGSSKLGKKRM